MREIAGALGREKGLGEPANRGLGRGQLLLDGEEPRDHALDVAVDRRGRRIERNRGDRRRRVGADAGQRGQRCFALREASAVPLDHGLGAGMQVARARVIAEPGPQFEHVIERCRRERVHVRQARRKRAK